MDKIDDSDDEEEVQKDTQVNDEVEGVNKRKLDKAKREASKVKSRFNPDPKQFVENNQPGRELILDRANLALNLTGKPKEPDSIDEAYNIPNLEKRAKWWEAIQRELKEMEDKGVYKKIEKSELPSNCVCVKNKWIFKIKRNGIFPA
jgi:hypothetical protein